MHRPTCIFWVNLTPFSLQPPAPAAPSAAAGLLTGLLAAHPETAAPEPAAEAAPAVQPEQALAQLQARTATILEALRRSQTVQGFSFLKRELSLFLIAFVTTRYVGSRWGLEDFCAASEDEDAVDPEREIIDPHHHLWDICGGEAVKRVLLRSFSRGGDLGQIRRREKGGCQRVDHR